MRSAKWKHTHKITQASTLTVSQSRLDHGAPLKMLSCTAFRTISTYFNILQHCNSVFRRCLNMQLVAFSSKDAWARSIWSNRTWTWHRWHRWHRCRWTNIETVWNICRHVVPWCSICMVTLCDSPYISWQKQWKLWSSPGPSEWLGTGQGAQDETTPPNTVQSVSLEYTEALWNRSLNPKEISKSDENPLKNIEKYRNFF